MDLSPPFRRVLVANRGEIALRVLRSACEMGMETVAVFSEVDRNALHVRRADRAVCIGESEPAKSYLCIDKIIEVAKQEDCDAIHPGYGFLAENADFARACKDAGLCFIGPSPQAIELMGDKLSARKAADRAGVTPVPGVMDGIDDLDELRATARQLGYPVMLKAAAGGGGKGIRIIAEETQLAEGLSLTQAEAKGAFGDDRVYLEKLLIEPRHIEIQIMGDQHGRVVHYGERECSVQRRHQKLLEESPSVALSQEQREAMASAAIRLAEAVDYVGAGTVEFLYSAGKFYFLEMNTRLQVEHPVTEMRFGVDLVQEQYRVAAGAAVRTPSEPRGHAIEVRINAEHPETLLPSLGKIQGLLLPGGVGVRMDSCLYRGLEVTPYYDSMLAKQIVHAEDRQRAIARMLRVLRELRIVGVDTSIPVAVSVLESDEFQSGAYDTGILERIDHRPSDSLMNIASLAAAVNSFLRTEPEDGSKSQAAESRISPWTALGRAENLGDLR